ncbi:MAG TPA: PrsW family glutamic-type intramembrane protease [Bacteroidota bacterium]|nr:PrsW family glutamic-type intramembrane protease [Bacteroidota bacterium]
MTTPPFENLANIAVALLPVFVFLGGLILLDSYKLVKVRSVVASILAGCLAAALLFVAIEFLHWFRADTRLYSRYGAPVIEEALKAGFLVYLIRARKVGFMVDAAIHGVAIGAGFALVENVYYLWSLNESLIVWVIRGFGTALMHGGATAIVGVVSKNLVDVKDTTSPLAYVPGYLAAVVIHSLFNHLIPRDVLGPVTTTAITVVAVPALIMAAFTRSERTTREWLGVGFDNDAELLTMITTGGIAQTRIGQYLDSIQSKFPATIVVDILCYLRLYLELAIQAKGILMMRESGFDVDVDPKVQAKFDEMTYLEKSIGKTGLLALSPFLRTSSRNLWQMHMLKNR